MHSIGTSDVCVQLQNIFGSEELTNCWIGKITEREICYSLGGGGGGNGCGGGGSDSCSFISFTRNQLIVI